jgi:hypothetical protein
MPVEALAAQSEPPQAVNPQSVSTGFSNGVEYWVRWTHYDGCLETIEPSPQTHDS